MNAFPCSPVPSAPLLSPSFSPSSSNCCLDIAGRQYSRPSPPILIDTPQRRLRPSAPAFAPRSRSTTVVAAASRRDDARYGAGDSGGRLVDEDMIVLRKRLHEMRAAETNCEAPAHWTDWEKRYYGTYGADVCHLVGLLQALLLKTRPSVAIGLLALVALSVPTSASVVALNLIGGVKAVLAGLHL